MSGKESKVNQSSKSTSSKRAWRERDISLGSPYSEFPAATSTFSGLAIALLLGLIGVTNTYASSISISLTGNVSLNLVKSNTEAVFGKSTTQTATVTSDHFTGYTLTIAGSNDTGRLVGANDSTKYLSSIPNAMSESTFNTDTYNDMWGFLPSKVNSITNNVYQPSPTTTATTIDVTNSPNTSGENYTLALAARVSPNMALDSYGQTFVLAATGNHYQYHIGYTDNSTNFPADQYNDDSASSTVQLSNVTPTKDGFVFKGWCPEPTTVNESTHETTCGTTPYQPGANIDLSGTSANNFLLYAIWAKGYNTFADAFAAFNKTKPSGSSYYAMQDIDSAICDSIIIGSPVATEDIAKNTLIDTRNNKTYLVAKYADGHCWMRENLNLPLTANTNVEAYDFNTGNTFNYKPAYTTQTTAGTTWAQDGSDGARSYGVDKDKYIGGMDINTSGGTGATTGQPYEKIGIIYNWTAATAQTGSQASAATSEVFTSICPKGWRLPANEGDYSFSELMGSYSLPTTNQNADYSGQLQNPLNFNRPGTYNWLGGSILVRGTRGYLWSSVGYSSMDAYYLAFRSAHFYPQDGDNKGNGFSVRCVAV